MEVIWITVCIQNKKSLSTAGRKHIQRNFFKMFTFLCSKTQKCLRNMRRSMTLLQYFFSHTDQTPWAQQFLKDILQNPEWKPVYLDTTIVILIKNIPNNTTLMKQFSLNGTNYTLPKNTDYQSLLQFANFFQTAGWKQQQKVVYQRLLEKNPTLCPALYGLTMLLNEEKNPAANIYATRFQERCQ